jgi:hypothetical protein
MPSSGRNYFWYSGENQYVTSRKTAIVGVKKLVSLKSDVTDNHHSKTAKFRDFMLPVSVLNTPLE